MSPVCILTDNTAQFIQPIFPGQELVHVIPLQLQLNGKRYASDQELKVIELPPSARNGLAPRVLAPSPETFRRVLLSLGQKYQEIVAVLMSSRLNQVFANLQQAAENIHCPLAVYTIDSQTTAIGLGLLVQEAARAAQNGASGAEIKHLLIGFIPHIYTVFYVQGLTYLYHQGRLDPAQALVGEMLGVTPFMILEKGGLVSPQKVRNTRHLVELFREFIGEFEHLKYIALLQGAPSMCQEAHLLRERILADFPNIPFSEHSLGTTLAALLGPRSLGLVIMEDQQADLA